MRAAALAARGGKVCDGSDAMGLPTQNLNVIYHSKQFA